MESVVGILPILIPLLLLIAVPIIYYRKRKDKNTLLTICKGLIYAIVLSLVYIGFNVILILVLGIDCEMGCGFAHIFPVIFLTIILVIASIIYFFSGYYYLKSKQPSISKTQSTISLITYIILIISVISYSAINQERLILENIYFYIIILIIFAAIYKREDRKIAMILSLVGSLLLISLFYYELIIFKAYALSITASRLNQFLYNIYLAIFFQSILTILIYILGDKQKISRKETKN